MKKTLTSYLWPILDIFISPKLQLNVRDHLHARFLLFTAAFVPLLNLVFSVISFFEGTYVVSLIEATAWAFFICSVFAVFICLKLGVAINTTSSMFMGCFICGIAIFLYSDNSAFAPSLLFLLFIPLMLQSILNLQAGLVGLAVFFIGGYLARQYFPPLPPIPFEGSLELTRDYLYVSAVMVIVPLFVLVAIKSHLQNLTDKELRQTRDELAEQAIRDGLTGLYNRRYFDQRLEQAWSDASRRGEPVSLAMLDVDYFKPYNDNYGHVKGDQCLIEVAQALKENVSRGGDVYARYGGEEFVILLPGICASQAESVVAKCRARLTEIKLTHAHSKTADYITFSAGIAEISPSQESDLTSLDLLKKADEALYQAKENGRNRSEIAKIS